MSLKSLTSIHTVDVYVESVTRGKAGGATRDFGDTPVTSGVLCRVKKLSVTEMKDLKVLEVNATWRVYFHSNPSLTQKNMLLFVDDAGATHRLYVKTVTNPHQMQRFWKVDCSDA